MVTFAIEKVLDTKWKEDPTAFPDHTCNYYSRYDTALGKLRPIYREINAGMALNSSPQGLFTDHGEDHFDEIVKYLGDLIPLDQVSTEGCVNPYELFVILMAARIHDVGNVGGRSEHEKYCFDTLCKISDGSDTLERNLIASIAQAHGGRSLRGCPDTIGDIAPSRGTYSKKIDARKCAALVRIADEICENRSRAFSSVDFSKEIFKGNDIYHTYASCITLCAFSKADRHLTINIDVPVGILTKRFTKPGAGQQGLLIIEEIALRLQKLDLERKYCNNHLPEELKIRGVNVAISTYKSESSSDGRMLPLNLIEITTHDFKDSGYPLPSSPLTEIWPELDPEKFISLVESKYQSPKSSAQGKTLFERLFGKRE